MAYTRDEWETIQGYEEALERAGWAGCRDDMDELRRMARRLHRIDERLCNGVQDWRGNWDEAGTTRLEKQAERLEQRMGETVVRCLPGYHIITQGDPRGWPAHIVADNDERNSIGVPIV
jgi:hypothetical protein